MASYHRHRNKRQKYHYNKGLRRNNGDNNGYNNDHSNGPRHRTRKVNPKWSKHVLLDQGHPQFSHSDSAPSPGYSPPPRHRKEYHRYSSHSHPRSTHYHAHGHYESTPESESMGQCTNGTDSENGGEHRKSYTEIVQQSTPSVTVISVGEPGMIGSAESTPEAIFMHNNTRRRGLFYQRKNVQEMKQNANKKEKEPKAKEKSNKMRGTKRKREDSIDSVEEKGDDQDRRVRTTKLEIGGTVDISHDIDARIASLEEATHGDHDDGQSTHSVSQCYDHGVGGVDDSDRNHGKESGIEKAKCESTKHRDIKAREQADNHVDHQEDHQGDHQVDHQVDHHVESVEAQIEKMELEVRDSGEEEEEEEESRDEVQDKEITVNQEVVEDSKSTDGSGLLDGSTLSGPTGPGDDCEQSPALSSEAREFTPDHSEHYNYPNDHAHGQGMHPNDPRNQGMSHEMSPPPEFQSESHYGHHHHHHPHGGQYAVSQGPHGPMGGYHHGSMEHPPHGHGQYDHMHHGPNGHNGYPYYEHQRMMEVQLHPPTDQNVNRWTQHQAQQQHNHNGNEIVEMGGPSPRHQHFGGPNHETTPPYPGPANAAMSPHSEISPPNTPYNLSGEFFVSIDVECAATGHGHFDSAPCRIAMVDFFGNVLYDQVCSVPNLKDPLSEFTGLSKWQIRNAPPLEKVLNQFHSKLAELNNGYRFGVTIVGQSLIMDLIWTQLKQGVHYNRLIDIAQLFKTKNEPWSKPTYYSLRQVAWGLMGVDMNGDYHDPTEDARVTMALYREFCLDEQVLDRCKHHLRDLKWKKKFPDFKVHTKFYQCSGMYSPSRCRCGQEVAVGVEGVEDLEKLRTLFNAHRDEPVTHIQLYPHYGGYHHH